MAKLTTPTALLLRRGGRTRRCVWRLGWSQPQPGPNSCCLCHRVVGARRSSQVGAVEVGPLHCKRTLLELEGALSPLRLRRMESGCGVAPVPTGPGVKFATQVPRRVRETLALQPAVLGTAHETGARQRGEAERTPQTGSCGTPSCRRSRGGDPRKRAPIQVLPVGVRAALIVKLSSTCAVSTWERELGRAVRRRRVGWRPGGRHGRPKLARPTT